VGVEALLRWTHATRGAIPPATFIPVAEQMGLMDTIGGFVLRRTLEEARRWPDELYVAVNLSPLQVRDSTIVDMVRSALAASGVAPSRLVLEITEGVLIDNPDEMVRRINDLHDLGVRVALDDFGSGYSNLGYLQRFPLDKLKIDKSFVAALGRSSNGGVIIQAIVALARALGLSVLVEGVETEHQRVLLRLAGCDEMQASCLPGPLQPRPSTGCWSRHGRTASLWQRQVRR
jgi:EAL domain-containing protein (putative c-di-GMP-specific phosphodiesterase class I)